MQVPRQIADLINAVKNTRKGKVIFGALVFLIVYMLFLAPGNPRRTRMMRMSELEGGPQEVSPATSVREKAEDLLLSFKTDMEELKKKQDEANADLADQKKQLEDYQGRTAEIFRKMLERMSENQAEAAKTQQQAAPVNVYEQTSEIPKEEQKLEAFGLEESEVAPPPRPQDKKVAFIGAGDTVRVKLLAGVNAPTDGTPYPAMFKLISEVYGPDGSTLPLGEARLIAAAQGSLTDSRALFRLTTLNIRLPTGERKVVNIDGWIVGEDGIRGVPGVLIDPIGKALGATALSGAMSGVGQSIAARNTQAIVNPGGGLSTVVSGNAAEYSAGIGLSQAANEYSALVRQRLGQLTPVVQILSGRELTAIFAANQTIEGLFEAIDENEGEESSLD
jgi:hypothetical protein